MPKKALKAVTLPTYVVPEHYELELKPDLEKAVFEGTEVVRLVLKRRTNEITFHAQDLKIHRVSLAKGQNELVAERVSYDPAHETATFHFEEKIAPGTYELRASFSGVLSDLMRGFYRSTYLDGKKKRYIATTQFEATDARRAFPCIDEPARKAVFKVALTVPKDLAVVSNTMPVEEIASGKNKKRVVFAETPKMSTYLLAFVVGDFEHLERRTKEGVLVRVFVTPDKKHRAAFALDCAVRMLSFYTEYFRIPFPLPVLDMIAIPDFSAAAMENWGAITYRESALLFDEEDSSITDKQWVALVVAHELAHQWFGNLVTMEWWTHLWLNEGFATYIEYLAVDHCFPEWDIWTMFITSDFGSPDFNKALRLDSFYHTHPIEVDVNDPGEIDEAFDSVSYAKGAAVIRMLSLYLGENVFRRSLQKYLKDYSYSNATTLHLWQVFEEVSGKPVVKMMRNWTRAGGYPLIEAGLASGSTKVRLMQTRFFLSRLAKRAHPDRTIWSVPLIVAAGGREKMMLLSERGTEIDGSGSWIKLNADAGSFVRVKYSKELLEGLKAPIRNRELGTRDRLQLVSDIFALAEAGDVRTEEALDLIEVFENETEHAVWLEIAVGLSRIYSLFHKESFSEDYAKFCRMVFSRAIGRVGFEPEPGEHHNRTFLRSLLLFHAGYYGEPEVVAWAKKMLQKAGSDKNPIPPDLRDTVYGIVAATGGEREFQKLVRLYNAASAAEEKEKIGMALGELRDPRLIHRALQFFISPKVRAQESTRFIAAILVNPYGRSIGWDFVRKNWNLLIKRYGRGYSLSRMVTALGRMTEDSDAKRFESFFKKQKATIIGRTISQVAENIRSNAAWRKADRRSLARWLSAKSQSGRNLL